MKKVLTNKILVKELYEEVRSIESGQFLTEEEFENKHKVGVLADESLLKEDWLSQEDEEAWKDL